MKDIIRRCIFTPFLKGKGPVFHLTVWDCHKQHRGGPQWQLGYKLTMKQPGGKPVVLFEGEDFGNSPSNSIDGDEMVVGIMGFLTLRPGDTDREYFDDYTPAQLEYCSQWAEALSCEVDGRFCDENGNVKKKGRR